MVSYGIVTMKFQKQLLAYVPKTMYSGYMVEDKTVLNMLMWNIFFMIVETFIVKFWKQP